MRRKRAGGKVLAGVAMLISFVLLAAGCSGGPGTPDSAANLDGYYTASEAELGKDHPIYIDTEANLVKVYATVNSKYLVESTRHGMNWVEGAYGDKAVLQTYANPLAFHDALLRLGGHPAVGKGEDPSQAFEQTPAGKFIKGDRVLVTVTWEGAGRDYDINEVMVDSSGTELAYRFGGNYDAAKEKMTGCFMCFDSCSVGITSNSAQPMGAFQDGKAEFRGNPDVLPEDGTPLVLTFKFAQ